MSPREHQGTQRLRDVPLDTEHECEFSSHVSLLGKAYLFTPLILFPAFSEIKLFYRGKERGKDMVEYLLVPGTLHMSSRVMFASL